MARSQTQKYAKNTVIKAEKRLKFLVYKSRLENADNIKIEEYSAMKIKAKVPPLYSTLNPETSSDSPSAKSKGVRLVSATQQMIHISKRGDATHRRENFGFGLVSSLHDTLCLIIINARRIKARLISYEIVCATPRIAPIIA